LAGVLRPGKAKTRSSKAPVAIPDIIAPLLRAWREENASAEGLHISNRKGHADPSGKLVVARAIGVAVPVNFQVLRRTFATNAQDHGNAKDVQTHLRHTDITTTLGVYTQPIDENVRKLVNAVAEDVMSAEELGAHPVTTPIQ
jgi:integrase